MTSVQEYWIVFSGNPEFDDQKKYRLTSTTPIDVINFDEEIIHAIDIREYQRVARELEARIAAEAWRKDKDGKLPEAT